MKTKINDDLLVGTFGKMKITGDFLPKPEDLIFNEKKTRVTITLTKKSLDFFKQIAQKHGASYQAMIRRLLDHYATSQRAV